MGRWRGMPAMIGFWICWIAIHVKPNASIGCCAASWSSISIVKAGMLYKKLNASPIEKTAIDATTVDSDSSNVQVHFKSDDQKFQSLMHSPLFAAVSH